MSNSSGVLSGKKVNYIKFIKYLVFEIEVKIAKKVIDLLQRVKFSNQSDFKENRLK